MRRKIPPRICLKRQSSRTYSRTKHMGSSWGRTLEMNSRWAKLLLSSLDIKEDGCLKTETRLNEDSIRPEQARDLDRQGWWACPPYLQRSCRQATTHTPCIHYHLRYKTYRSHHGLIKRARQTHSPLTLSPFPLFLHWRSPLPFCFLFLFPSSPFLGLCSR